MKLHFTLFVLSALFYCLIITVGLTFTGKTRRAYQVLASDEIVLAGEKGGIAEKMAEDFMPEIYTPHEGILPAPAQVRYEIIEDSSKYSLVYHFEWQSEKHPDFAQNIYRGLFRFVYHANSLRDSEFVQLDVRKHDGKITRMLFPSVGSGTTWKQPGPQRGVASLELAGENSYHMQLLNQKGKVLEERNVTLASNQKPVLKVANWDHTFVPLQKANPALFTQNFPLERLEDVTYREQKYARREQGTYKTAETPANIPVMLFVSFIFTGYLFMLARGYALNKITHSAPPATTAPPVKK